MEIEVRFLYGTFMIWLKLILAAIVAILKAWFGSGTAQDRKDKDLDKKKAELKAIEMEIDDVQKNLADAINLGVTVLVNILSARLVGLSARRDELNSNISGKL